MVKHLSTNIHLFTLFTLFTLYCVFICLMYELMYMN
uniref:Uncharacterized protein n=1 Tax=Myoviridae sp. ctdNl2 TaxID=2825140 RepID=A0A8S5QGN7_9CAUD|nr:MAG TPA: hypothetical protein [Myoviridae sp. ctdNl2]